jgi:hypothetical protein
VTAYLHVHIELSISSVEAQLNKYRELLLEHCNSADAILRFMSTFPGEDPNLPTQNFTIPTFYQAQLLFGLKASFGRRSPIFTFETWRTLNTTSALSKTTFLPCQIPRKIRFTLGVLMHQWPMKLKNISSAVPGHFRSLALPN